MWYGQTLESIERNYGCVAEYNRQREERELDMNDPWCNEIYDDIPEENEIHKFEIGQTYRKVGIYGGVTYYKIEKIDRENNKIECSQTWEDLDGAGTRPNETFDLRIDEDGNEKFLEWTSETYGDIWIEAYKSEVK